MRLNTSQTRFLNFSSVRRQTGQALIYGIFVLLGGLAALFFLFNTGQLSREKTKLVNTSDAVAYSAGVMHARALNYIAYTNRAMIANEVSIAQMVSLSSWAQYVEEHGSNGAVQLTCGYVYTNQPAWEGVIKYSGTCLGLYWAYSYGALTYGKNVVQYASQIAMQVADTAKQALQLAQDAAMLQLPIARRDVMNEVAQANYRNDGAIKVDLIPLRDTFYMFDGGPIFTRYTKNGDERKRFAEATTSAVALDEFVSSRNWIEYGIVPTCLPISLDTNYAERTGGTKLNGYDEWKANDSASYVKRYFDPGNPNPFKFRLPSCGALGMQLGSGAQAANNSSSSGGSASSGNWNYSGIPRFYDLSEKALAYTPENADVEKRDPKIQFAIRVTRSDNATNTSDATSRIKASPRFNAYQGQAAKNLYASVSASEVFFSRPVPRSDGNRELASLFNPYWQVRLIEAPTQVKAAQVLQGVILP